MSKIEIQNIDELAKYKNREQALEIIKTGLNFIETDRIISSSVSIDGDFLRVKNEKFNLNNFDRIRVIGFGKASCEAALSLEKNLGSKIKDGVIIDIKTTKCEYITSLEGTHPRPSIQNATATKQILDLAKGTNERDLYIVVVSGGGSALLCSTEEECSQGERLYDEFIKTGANIDELNTVRKHISFLKGGGLAKVLYPATIVSLIFCDVPGDNTENVASGPTHKDKTTIKDAQDILDKYGLKNFDLNETPKEDVFFEKVYNISLISNIDALEAMSKKAREFGFETEILGTSIYDTPEKTLDSFKKILTPKKVVLGGGEVKLQITKSGGSGGRCAYLGLEVIPYLEDNDIFIAIASDGIDNSPGAGVIVDKNTKDKMKEIGLDLKDYLDRYDAYNFFKKTDDLIITGQTGANVSDLMLWIKQ